MYIYIYIYIVYTSLYFQSTSPLPTPPVVYLLPSMIDFGLCHVRETVDLDLGTWLVRFTEGLSELERESPFLEKETYLQTLWMFPKTMGFPPKSSILIGFSIINPSILGYPYFWKPPFVVGVPFLAFLGGVQKSTISAVSIGF